jgi:hypothetical protein
MDVTTEHGREVSWDVDTADDVGAAPECVVRRANLRSLDGLV